MTNLNFPTNPTIGQTHTVGSKTYIWNGSAWIVSSTNSIVATSGTFQTVVITGNNDADNTFTGALVVAGGAGIGGDVYIGGVLSVAGSIILTTSSFNVELSEGPDIDITVDPLNNDLIIISNISTLQTVTGRGFTTTNKIFVANPTESTSSISGALTISGGVGIGKNVWIGGELNVANRVRLFDTTSSTSTQTGALQVSGGIAAKNIYAGENISGQSLTARNLTQNRVALVDAGGLLTDNSGLVYNTSTNILNGTITFAITATNINSGVAGQLVYQSSTGTTGFVAVGTSGFVLSSNGSAAPSWISIDGLVSGNSTTATNIAGGTAGQLHYQSAPGVTAFVSTGTAGQILVSGGAAIPVYTSTTTIYVGRSVLADTATTATSAATAYALANTSTTYVGRAALADLATGIFGGTAGQLVYQSSTSTTTFVSTSSAGNVLVSNGTGAPAYQNTLTLAGTINSVNTSSGTLIVVGGVGIGQTLQVGGKIFVRNTETSVSTTTGALVVTGGAGIARSLTVGESINVGTTTAGSVIPAVYSNNFLLASFTSPVITSIGIINLDVFNGSLYRTAKYTVQIVDGASVYATEILVTHNGTTAYMSEYGIISNNGQLGNFDISYSGGSGNVVLNFLPTTVSSMTIKVVRIGFTA
jgi:hypothetical protein